MTVVVRNLASNKNFLMFPFTGNHGHSTDHLWHSHPRAWAAWDDGGSGWSSPPAATRSGQATNYGYWSHLQCLGWDEEPDSPWCPPGGVSEMEAGRRVILNARWSLKPWLCWSNTQFTCCKLLLQRIFVKGTSHMCLSTMGVNKRLILWQFELLWFSLSQLTSSLSVPSWLSGLSNCTLNERDVCRVMSHILSLCG